MSSVVDGIWDSPEGACGCAGRLLLVSPVVVAAAVSTGAAPVLPLEDAGRLLFVSTAATVPSTTLSTTRAAAAAAVSAVSSVAAVASERKGPGVVEVVAVASVA